MGLSLLQQAVWTQGARRVAVPGLTAEEILHNVKTLPGSRLFEWYESLAPEQRLGIGRLKREGARRVLLRLSKLTPDQQEDADYDWRTHGRPEQFAPEGKWRTWVIQGGRGWGKTLAGAQLVRERVEAGDWRRPYIVGATASDVRDVMVEGPSGILAITPLRWRPKYEPSKRRLTWPNGAIGILRSAEKPDRMRGPQGDGAWLDELMAWKYPQDAYDQLKLGLRLGNPQMVITTTPRPLAILKAILKDPHTIRTGGSTYDNADNLAATYIDDIWRKYRGTRLGKQEVEAILLEDNPNALWKLIDIEIKRLTRAEFLDKHKHNLREVGVAIDPATSENPDTSNETGIITGGSGMCDCAGKPALHGYVFDDSSGVLSARDWAVATGTAFTSWRATKVIGEINQGGNLIRMNLEANAETRGMVFHGVHAKDGKRLRAEPVSALYEQRIVHHVGTFPALEDQMTQWDPKDPMRDESPDRVDALVHLFTDLLVGPSVPEYRKHRTGYQTRR